MINEYIQVILWIKNDYQVIKQNIWEALIRMAKKTGTNIKANY